MDMLTRIDPRLLAEAFPDAVCEPAMAASERVDRLLYATQWIDRFTVSVGPEDVLIPTRLHFASEGAKAMGEDGAWRFVRALQTRSSDGFQRQRAVRDLLAGTTAWEAPFIVALLGEYIVEILDDVADALDLDLDLEQRLAVFIVENPTFWATTKRRIMSYWNVYYRWRHASDTRRPYSRAEYVGFKLVDRLDAAAHVAMAR